MEKINNFCSDAESVSINTSNVTCLETCVVNIDYQNDEVKRTRYSNTGNCFFNMELNLSDNITLDEEIELMRTIDLYYYDVFSWRFNGEHLECYAIIPHKAEFLGIYGRFRGIFGFIKALRDQLIKVCKYRGNNIFYISKIITNMMLSNASINRKSDLYVVPILPSDSKLNILIKAKNRIISEEPIKTLDMKYWVKEINPDFEREVVQVKREKMMLTDNVFDNYPPCIKAIANLPTKGNYARFLLASYLLNVHGERDAKHQLLTMLTDEERAHVETGNCKDQWRAIVTRQYPTPSCKKMMENGYCLNDCGRPRPDHNVKQDAN